MYEYMYISGTGKRRRRRRHIESVTVTTEPFQTQINLTWERPGGLYVDSYDIYRDGTLIGTVITTMYSDTGLTPATFYTYKVVASNKYGGTSESTVTETTLTTV